MVARVTSSPSQGDKEKVSPRPGDDRPDRTEAGFEGMDTSSLDDIRAWTAGKEPHEALARCPGDQGPLPEDVQESHELTQPPSSPSLLTASPSEAAVSRSRS